MNSEKKKEKISEKISDKTNDKNLKKEKISDNFYTTVKQCHKMYYNYKKCLTNYKTVDEQKKYCDNELQLLISCNSKITDYFDNGIHTMLPSDL